MDRLQTDEQRKVLDAITDLRKCGLDSILSLPDIVVCGDQSAGKSSVLEALTEIPFPRNDNLCTRFATEISLRRAVADSLTVKVVPDSARPEKDQIRIKEFSECITDISDLPIVIDAATRVMDITTDRDDNAQAADARKSAFSKDTLSIEISGPSRPQLTVIDIPGLIQSSTRGVSEEDVVTVTEITDRYIKQPRTICLAVISATNDAANQSILRRVRNFDPAGKRTLGVITKPDQLPAGSGTESKFLELAQNKDVFFSLGWHVIRNRRFDEKNFTFHERNTAEAHFFQASNFNVLPSDMVGIAALRERLSLLLFQHVRAELPQLNAELERALAKDLGQLKTLGDSRQTPSACRIYLTQFSIECQEICKSAINGNYEHDYFKTSDDDIDEEFSLEDETTIARLRAVIQHINHNFSQTIRKKGYKYHLEAPGEGAKQVDSMSLGEFLSKSNSPKRLSRTESVAWVKKLLQRSRGRELMGNVNPYLIGELFWDQCRPWEHLAKDHVHSISQLCEKFWANLLKHRAPQDIRSRIWARMVHKQLQLRKSAASQELGKLLEDLRGFPINYNHYYTDMIQRRRQERLEKNLGVFMPAAFPHQSYEKCSRGSHYEKYVPELDMNRVVQAVMKSNATTIDMDTFSIEEALDCMRAIYKVQYKTFVANVTTQVIERHLVRGLENIVSPLVVVKMSDSEVEAIALEQTTTKQQRIMLVSRVRILEEGRAIFQELIGS
ncbi:interferon-induced GTP-binding protein Mx [Microdochium trichocladiopsis]|uniref:Interferon-induced GTP-binding protein Mx n=1 Tax=Microdochium trichocladiopsis TaxID=1682393 RepID=A0A9P9BHT7_9PEZI|nr:interferon-induced GTP-binding protein Mx [Microdochium trichocladiopsis]KAH7012256.1 interferon-induced GTP-binding protein Mx [Microdochium trichocladiopsis]